MSEKVVINEFFGIKNDSNPKQSESKYFYNIVNFNFESTSTHGLEKVLCPKREIQIGNDRVDGIYEYRFLNCLCVLIATVLTLSEV